jgi:competence protein ComEC
VVVAFYIALLAALTGTSRPRAWSSRAACAALAIGAVGIATAAGLELSRPARGWIRLTMLDVGQGEALVVQLPGGRTLLVDAGGGTPRFDVGERVIAPTLWSLGVRRLTWLAITHPDLDHIGGAMSVATIFGPDEIWEGVPVDGELTRLALLAHARREGIGRRRLQRGDVVEAGGVVVTVVSPALSDWERVRTRNDDSLVLRVRYGDVEWLLTGDVGAGVERQWLAEPTDALIRVLKVPHHGSRWSSSANLLDGYRPHLAVVSVGAQNLFGHPAPEVLARFQARRIPVFRTDTSGAVVMESDGHELRVRTMTGERTTVRISR